MAKQPKSQKRQDLREAQLAWLERLEDHTDKDATNLARGAQIDPSTLTRFKSAQSRTLSVLTLQQLAERWQFPLDPSISGATEIRGFATEAEPYKPKNANSALMTALDALRSAQPGSEAWEVRSRALEAVGILPGDVVLVDPFAKPRDGDAVLAQIWDFERQKFDDAWRRISITGPIQILAAASFDPNYAGPVLVNEKDVKIKGVVLGHRLRPVDRAA
ncbi:hypothetical protein VRZ08_05425 [Rhodopseudomonas sp. G2_2311]|uniref:LexA family protein n=1 Tax=Rhodopseudomonas sp. G2_2311 TaxID=3114287 RepID=UPI0039C5F87E